MTSENSETDRPTVHIVYCRDCGEAADRGEAHLIDDSADRYHSHLCADCAPTETEQSTADAVIFGERAGQLYVLLILRGWEPFKGCLALPGGYVEPGEATEPAARRELAEETGLSVGALTSVGFYFAPGRDPRGRFVSTAYTCRVVGTPILTAGDDAAQARWVPIDVALAEGTELAFDHALIIRDALRLSNDTSVTIAPAAEVTEPLTLIVESSTETAAGPVTVSAPSLAALVATLTAAGLTVSVRHFPETGTVSYVHADRAEVSLTLRRPNESEIPAARTATEPAAETADDGAQYAHKPMVRVGYPVRVLPADPDSSKHSGRGRYQGSTGIVMRRGADGWAGEGQPGTERWGVRLDNATADPEVTSADRIVFFRATDLEVIGDVSQDNTDPYPCANCHGRGRSGLAPLDPCSRCDGNGVDPYVNL